MKIGDLAKATGLSPSRIRFYEAEGLINPPPRQANGYRNYSPDTAGVLKIIDNAQRAGFSLEQIRHFLPRGRENWDHTGLMQSLKTRVAEIERLQHQLAQNKRDLLALIANIENRPDDLSCEDNMQRLVGQLPDTAASGD
ncbi:MerR family transcriptional regulator [Serratia marcescens]|uniref:MerR family transcriptional regulator n=1 Tax=Serratia marcescens TaxID=615 RepID=A0A1Q4P245_SERMA|nr:MerR family transcriptional regulator [Serratia marcescens]OKB67187.1 MerR family transcriptional regulator [Serratia marcescens]